MVGRNHRALLEEGKIIYDNQIFVFILFFLAERKMRSAIDKEREANDLQQLVSFSFLICKTLLSVCYKENCNKFYCKTSSSLQLTCKLYLFLFHDF